MTTPGNYKPVKGTEHIHPASHAVMNPTAGDQPVTATVILHRRQNGGKLREMEDFSAESKTPRKRISQSDFAEQYGADPNQLAAVEAFAKAHRLEVVESNPERRSVVVRGSAAAIGKAFAVELHDYDSPRGKYHGHTGTASLPGELADSVEAVIGLDNRQVPAKHFSTAKKQNPADPANTNPLTPQQVAHFYNFPAGAGAGQTIGIYEMQTQDEQGNPAPAGYTVQDITASIKAFGGNLKVPQPIDVPVDGVTNSGQSDGETGLDITIAGAVAQGAKIAVYFTGGTSQSIVHALQAMIHPKAGAPEPSVISISYGWGPDDASADSFSAQEYTQIDQLFQDAANLSITVLVSSGDSGAFIESTTQAQTSLPATDPWVTACGGTTIGNVKGTGFDEYVWNDTGKAGHGATGGGISAHFTTVPSYQSKVKLPSRNGTNTAGRGIPDLAGNASENSGYMQSINGQLQAVGGTSAVAPLYAGLIAIINANLGSPVGFLNPVLYSAQGVFRAISSPPGPDNNSFGKVTGYPATAGWNACTGLGSVNGTALQAALKTAIQSAQAKGA